MWPLLRGFEDLGNRRDELAPCAGFRVEPRAPLPRQLVVLRAAIVVGGAPARLDPAPPFEPVKRRVERPLADVEGGARNQAEPLRDGPPVLRLEGDRFQDEQVECPLWEIEPFAVHSSAPFYFDRRL